MKTQTQPQDWRDIYRTLSPEEQTAIQNAQAPTLPGTKTRNAFTQLLLQFVTDATGREHDEKGLFTEKGGEGLPGPEDTRDKLESAYSEEDGSHWVDKPNAIPDWYNKEANAWDKSLSPEEEKAAQDYTGSYLYSEINQNAITNTPDPRVTALDAALEKSPVLPTHTLAYRNVNVGTSDQKSLTPEQRMDAFLSQYKPGQEITLAKPGAFQSTSISPRYPMNLGHPHFSVMFEILAKRAAPIGNVTKGAGTVKEAELLFPRSARFKVVSIQRDVPFAPKLKNDWQGNAHIRNVIQVEQV